MFKRKECQKCQKKISEDANYCSNCGNPFKENQKDYGMLGKNDELDQLNNFDEFSNSLLGSFGKNMFNKMLGSAMKMIEQEMKKELENPNLQNMPKTNFELFINGKRISPDKIKVSHKAIPVKTPQKEIQKFIAKHFSEEQQKKFSSLTKEEPKTTIKRLSDRIIYEVSIPEINSIKDISIIPLENNIEIKAISKDKAYFKSIPVNLPIISHEISEGKLILELGIEE